MNYDSVFFFTNCYKNKKQINKKQINKEELINLKLDTALNWTNDEAVIKLIYEVKKLVNEE